MRRPVQFSPASRAGLSESKLKTARALSIVEADPAATDSPKSPAATLAELRGIASTEALKGGLTFPDNRKSMLLMNEAFASIKPR